jgi:hypothetical protein
MTYGKAFLFLCLVAIFAFAGTLVALRVYTMSGQRGLTEVATNGDFPQPKEESATLRRPRFSPGYFASGSVWEGAPVPPLGG